MPKIRPRFIQSLFAVEIDALNIVIIERKKWYNKKTR